MSRNVSDTSPAASASAARSRSRPKVAETGSVLLRGGRLTRVAGVVASYAPALGRARPALLTSVSALALSAAAFLGFGTAGALAQATSKCTDPGNTGTLTCSGQITVQENINGQGQPLRVSVDPSALVTIGTSAGARDGEAFYLGNSSAPISFTQSSATQVITGHTKALYIMQSGGSGEVSVSAAGTLVGRAQDSVAIMQSAVSAAAPTTVNVATVTAMGENVGAGIPGGGSGINVAKHGGGAITVTASGPVRTSGSPVSVFLSQPSISLPGTSIFGTRYIRADAGGIRVWALGSGTNQAGDISIRAGVVESAGHGIYAKNLKSSGAVSIVATGAITSNGTGQGVASTPNWAGIYAYSSSTAGISVTAANVTASSVGIRAVTASGANGSIAISSDGTISAGTKGVEAVSRGTGNITVNVGTVNAAGGIGIEAQGGDDGDVSISANSVSAASGSAAIMATSSGSGDITITAGQVTAGTTGIHAESSGSGDIAITATGSVTATDKAILAKTDSGGVSVAIGASGSVSSTATTSRAAAIYASASDSITITAAGVVSGERYGIYANNGSNSGTSSIAINVSGKVTGGTVSQAAAIRTRTGSNSSATVTIILESGASVGDTGSTAISDGRGNSVVTARAGSTISGTISLDAGDDELVISGATVAGAVSFGADDDTLMLDGTSGTITGDVDFGSGDDTLTLSGNGSKITGDVDFGGGDDTLNISGGAATISGELDGGSGSGDQLFVTQGTVALGSGTDATMDGWETITIGGSATTDPETTITVGTGVSADGKRNVGFNPDSTVTLNRVGVISLKDDLADQRLQLHNLTGASGTIVLDARFGGTSQSDEITVRGSISGTTYVEFRPIGGTPGLPADPKINNQKVRFAFVASGAEATSFRTRGDYKITQEVLGNGAIGFDVQYSPAACEEGTTGSGVFDCERNISATQALTTSGDTNLVVNLSNAGEEPSGASIITAAGDALKLTQTSGGRNITFTQSGTGEITGAEHAINVMNAGSGTVSISTTGVVTGGTGSAISVYNARGTVADAGSNVTISATGLLTSSRADAVNVFNGSSGTGLSVTVATVTTTAPDVDRVRPADSSNSVSATYTISYSAIRAENAGTGNVRVVATGPVSSEHGTAIIAANRGAIITGDTVVRGSSVVVRAGEVSGGKSGIAAFNSGTGSVTVTATGAITARRGLGVDAVNQGSGDLTIDVKTVTANRGLAVGDADGRLGGIRAVGEIGDGNVHVTAAGDVSTDQGHGIYAAALGAEQNADGRVRIITAGVSAGGSGIRAVARGDIEVTVTGTVSSAGTSSKSVPKSPQQEDRVDPLTLNATTVNDDAIGNFDAGIYASATGAGAISVSARRVTASGFGVYATGGGNIDISVASVTAGGDGVVARSSGGSVSIETEGTVNAGTSATHSRLSTGIFARSASTASAGVTVTATEVNGGAFGIYAKNEGTGTVSVTAGRVSAAGGTLSGLTLSGTGILSAPTAAVYAMNDGSGAGVSVSVNSAMGDGHGIHAVNRGSGDLRITASSNVTSNASATDFTGITARDEGSGGSLFIQAGTVRSDGGDAIYAKHFGAASNSSATINVATVTGGRSGIYLHSDNGGDVSVKATGNVSAMGSTTNGDGFKVADPTSVGVGVTNAGGGGVAIDVKAVTASAGHGISATNSGAGAITVKAAGAVTAGSSSTARGVYVNNSSGNGTSVSIDVSDVSAGGDAIRAKNMGTGALTVSANTVSGGGSGVDLHNSGGGLVSLTVLGSIAATGTGADNAGVKVVNVGDGGVSIDLRNEVTASGGHGISAIGSGARGDVTVMAGTVTVTEEGTGIYAKSQGSGDLTVSADSVSGGKKGIYLNNSGSSGSGLVSLTVAGGVSATGTGADDAGVKVMNAGSGKISIDLNTVSAGQGHAINAENSDDGDLDIAATGRISNTSSGTAAKAVVSAKNMGSGNLSISVATVSSVDGGGIYARGSGGDLMINATGGIEATGSMTSAAGIDAATSGSGKLTISATSISTSARAIDAMSSSGTLDIAVTGQISILGSSTMHAVRAMSSGTGDLSISVATVSSIDSIGIHATNSGGGDLMINATGGIEATGSMTEKDGIWAKDTGAGALTISATTITAGKRAIYAMNSDGGDLDIDVTGQISIVGSGTNAAVEAMNEGAGSLSISVATVSSVDRVGIDATNSGGGDLMINATGDVMITGSTTSELMGIKAVNQANTSSLTIMAQGVTGGEFGVHATNRGSGDLTISTTGEVTSTSSATSTNHAAIYAKNESGGDLTIMAAGDVMATGSMTSGINAINNASASSLTIMAREVTGGKFGVQATNSGGDLMITAEGAVRGTQGRGISAEGSATIVSAATVTGDAGHGIYIKNNADGGHGLVSVTTTGAVTGVKPDSHSDEVAGIHVDNVSGSGVTVNAAAWVTGPDYGIVVKSSGTADNGGIAIMAQDVRSETIGVFASNTGTGAVSVVVAGSVNIEGSGTKVMGIHAYSTNVSNITVEAAQINAANAGFGIRAVKGSLSNGKNDGVVSIKTTGSISANGSITESSIAIFASGGNSMTIDASGGLVSGSWRGIDATVGGTGILDIKAASVSAASGTAIRAVHKGTGSGTAVLIDAGTVTANGTGANAAGIDASSEASGGITITAANVNVANGHGIRARNTGSGEIMINLTGTASSNSGTAIAIYAKNSGNGSSITVNAASVSGTGSGIKAINLGSGTISVTATTISVEGSTTVGGVVRGVKGIDVTSQGAGDIKVNATTVSAGGTGIMATNSGGGSISIDVESVSAGTAEDWAIRAENTRRQGSSITVNVASASGEGSGVKIDNMGSGSVTVDATSIDVDGDHGIYVMNSSSGDSVNITAGSVSADGDGSTAAGIHAVNSGSGGLTISAGSVAGGGHGINAEHKGDGSALSINVTGFARSSGTGANHAAIRAFLNSTKGTDLTITAASAEGVGHGVHATNSGDGALSVSVGTARSTGTAASDAIHANHEGEGALTVSAGTAESANGKGIHAAALTSSMAITITAARVAGGTHGVYARHYNDGGDVEVTITESLSVSGSGGRGIESKTGTGGETRVVIARNATVTASGADARAIKTDDGTATIEVNAGANVTGGIETGDGADRVSLLGNGIRFAGNIDLEDGGEEEDRVILSGDGITLAGNIVLGKGPDKVRIEGDNVRIEGDIELGLDGDTHANVLTLSGDGISIDGNIRLGDGTDQLTFSGRNISVGETINFGRGNDSLSFGVGATTIASLDGGSGGEAGAGDVLTFQRGSNVTLNGRNPLLNWESVIAREGSRVRFDGKQTLESKELRFEQGSVLSMRDGATDDELRMQVVSFTGHGSLEIDVDFAGGVADKLMVERNTIYDPEQKTGHVIDGRVSENTPHSPTQIVMRAMPASGDVETGTKIRVAEVEGDLLLEGESGTGRGFIFAKGDGNSVPGDSTKLYVGAFELTLELERESNGNEHTFDVSVVDRRVNDAGAVLEMAPSVIVSRFATPPSLSKRTFGRQIAAFDGTTFGLVSQNFSEDSRIIGAGAGESWIRAYGEVVDFGRSTSGADTESVGYGVQAGADVASYELGNGDLVVGLAGQYGQVTADVTSNNHRNGEISTSGYGLGAIASWFGSGGVYVDVQTQINWLESDLTSSSAGVLATGNETSAVFTSVEIGRRFAFGGNGAVVPQGQISRGQIDTDPFENGPNFEVKFGNETAVIARLGVAAEFTDANGKGYLTANLLHDFSETRSVEISGTKLRDQSDSTMFEVGLGGSVAVSDRSIIFVEGSYKSAIGGDGNDERSTGLSGGFQWKW